MRHIGFQADDLDSAHEQLIAAGMETAQRPHRRDATRMYTSFLRQPGIVEVQLCATTTTPRDVTLVTDARADSTGVSASAMRS